jgi:hypothetical protein
MPPLSTTIIEQFGLDTGPSEEQIRASVAAAADDTVPPLSEDGRDILVDRLMRRECNAIECVEPFSPVTEWQFVEIVLDGVTVAKFLFCPSLGFENESILPSAGESLVVDAFVSGIKTIDQIKNIVLVNSIVSWLTDEQMDAIRVTLRCGSARVPTSIPWFADRKTRVTASATSRFAKDPYARLLKEANQQSIPKWRFFQFYRILEQGYLSSILEKLTSIFREGPKEALARASTALNSEREQLIHLISDEHLSADFEAVVDILDAMKSSTPPNKFAFALDRKINRRNLPKAANGAALIYAIRCAIAHAGGGDIFYEQYDDADELMCALLPAFESTVFQFLGISAT